MFAAVRRGLLADRMSMLASHPELLGTLACGAILMMMRLGLKVNALTPRRSSRRCPSCGLLYAGRLCRRCGDARHGT